MNNRRQIALELHEWTRGKRGSFSSILFELIEKSDYVNRAKLAGAFPEYVATYQEYSTRGEKFFDQLNLKNREKTYQLRRVS